MAACFTAPDAWLGGYYELALEFAPLPDERLDAALQALGEAARLDGYYLRPDVEPPLQERVPPLWAALEAGNHLRGAVTLPYGQRVPCGIYGVREVTAVWLGQYVPLGSLAGIY